MQIGPAYVLDADVLMTAARTYYVFDLVPTFWDALVQQAKNGRIESIDRVKNEIDRSNGELKRWANNQFRQWFVSTNDAGILEKYREVIKWASTSPDFTPATKDEFAQGDNADAWLVAYACAKGRIVVK